MLFTYLLLVSLKMKMTIFSSNDNNSRAVWLFINNLSSLCIKTVFVTSKYYSIYNKILRAMEEIKEAAIFGIHTRTYNILSHLRMTRNPCVTFSSRKHTYSVFTVHVSDIATAPMHPRQIKKPFKLYMI